MVEGKLYRFSIPVEPTNRPRANTVVPCGFTAVHGKGSSLLLIVFFEPLHCALRNNEKDFTRLGFPQVKLNLTKSTTFGKGLSLQWTCRGYPKLLGRLRGVRFQPFNDSLRDRIGLGLILKVSSNHFLPAGIAGLVQALWNLVMMGLKL